MKYKNGKKWTAGADVYEVADETWKPKKKSATPKSIVKNIL